MMYFCTYCDRGYAARLLCLHASLRRQGEPLTLAVLCFDAEVAAVVNAARDPNFIAIPLAELLAADSAYTAVRDTRTRVEFFFTTTPVLVRHCFTRFPEATAVTYLDADLFFFGPASAVWREQDAASVGIVPHRFPPRLAERLQYGTYNVAWVSFRRDDSGLAAVAWWRERCLEWCHDRVEPGGRFADQGYLDEFPRRFHVAVLEHPGIDAAPWNIGELTIAKEPDGVRVGGRPLLFYHFQGIREVAPGWFEPGLQQYGVKLHPALADAIYRPYLRELATMQARLAREHGIPAGFRHVRLHAGATPRERWERWKARWVLPWRGRLQGRLLHVRAD